MSNESNPLSIYGDGTVTFDQFVALFLGLNELYHAISGDKLQVVGVTGIDLVTESESEFEQHSGTVFENKTISLEDSPLTPYAPRDEVYEAIKKYAKPETVKTITGELDKKYPVDTWKDSFPTSGACEILLNQHLDDLILK